MESETTAAGGSSSCAPYPGPSPYTSSTAKDFHCRDDLIRRILDRLDSCRAVAIAGPPGCGKSSVVLAGVLPSLNRRVSRTVLLRPVPGRSLRTTVREALAPALDNLPARTVDPLFDSPDEPDPQAVRLTAESLARDAGTVIVVDQFEELVERSSQDARHLLNVLTELAHAVPGALPAGPAPVRFLVTVRGCDLDELIVPHTASDLERGVVFVAPLSTDQLRTALERPALDRSVRFDSTLLDRLLKDSQGRADRMSLLQQALVQLWESRDPVAGLTCAAYDGLGDLFDATGTPASAPRESLVAASAKPTVSAPPAPQAPPASLTSPASTDGSASQAGSAPPVPTDPSAVRAAPVEPAPPSGSASPAACASAAVPGTPAVSAVPTASAASTARANSASTTPLAAAHRGPHPSCPPADGPALRGKDAGSAGSSPGPSHRPRGRRPRLLTASLGVAVLGLSVLAGTGWASWDSTRADLSEQEGLVLGHRSLEQAAVDDDFSLRLALAAWRKAPDSSEAYAALLSARLRLADARQVLQPLPEDVAGLDASANGGIIVTADPGGTVRVRTGEEAWNARPWQVGTFPDLFTARLSDDGRYLVVARRSGAVTVWDVRSRGAGRTIRPAGTSLSGLGIAPDGSVLGLVTRTGTTLRSLELWNLASGRRLPHRIKMTGATELAGVSPAGTYVTLSQGPAAARRLTVRLGRTGAAVRTVGTAAPVLSGSAAVTCTGAAGKTGTLTVRPLWNAGAPKRVSLPNCPGSWSDQSEQDSSGRFLVLRPDEGSAERLLIDLHDGDLWRCTAGSAGSTGSAQVLVTRDEEQAPDVVRITSGALVRYTARGAWSPSVLSGATAATVSADGKLVAVVRPLAAGARGTTHRSTVPSTGFRLSVLNASTGRTIAKKTVPARQGEPALVPLLLDGVRLLAAGPTGPVLLRTGDLSRSTPLQMPSSTTGKAGDKALTSSTAVLEAGGGLVALHGGQLIRWDITGTATSSTVPVARTVPVGSGHTATQLAGATLLARPGHPGQVLLVVGDTVEVWDLAGGQRLTGLRPLPGEAVSVAPGGRPGLAIDRGGRFLALSYRSRSGIEVREVDTGRAVGTGLAAPAGYGPALFARDDLLVLVDTATSTASLWNTATGNRVLTLAGPAGSRSDRWDPSTARWTAYSPQGTASIDLSAPDDWSADLCRLVDHSFTGTERSLLPSGTGKSETCG